MSAAVLLLAAALLVSTRIWPVLRNHVKAAARILSTETPAQFAAAVREAADRLRAGELVAVPTETVYGLAANAWEAAAVGRLFAVKGRPANNPIIVHVADESMARRCVAEWPARAARLAAAFWPGPLTLVLPRAPGVPDAVTAGGETVGVRCPSHPFMRALIGECGFPLAAPSANRSTELSPTTAEHVFRSLGRSIGLIVDGGTSQVGIESAVVDVTGRPARVLRPGMIHLESLLAALAGEPVEAASTAVSEAGALRSPGQLRRHYAPRAPLAVASWRDDRELLARLAALGWDPARVHVVAHSCIPSGRGVARVSIIPHDPPAFARALYAELHRCDEEGAGAILVEAVPEGRDWEAISDRLQRASAGG